jgi:serine/threonine protein kinase
MPYVVSIKDAQQMFPDYVFVRSLTPSVQKAAFHVKDKNGDSLCLKLIAPNYERDRLDREIEALQTINHPNVVKLIEYTFSSKVGQQRHYIIEEFIDGQDLSDILLPGQPWPMKAVAEFFLMLCNGLFAMKEKEIVHRDLKPANIRVRPNSSPVIIDFGLSQHLNLPDLTQTVIGAAIGTPMYFAPEQFEGTRRDIDHRTDLFAVGILIYEALTGESPFYQPPMTIAQLRYAVCESTIHLAKPSFQALDSKWQTLLDRLLQKERALRPSNARQIGAILKKIGGL